MKQAGFRLTNEVASICQDMEWLTATITDSSQGLSQPQEWVLQVQDLAYDIQDFVDIYYWLRIRSLRHTLAHVSNIVQLKESIRTLREWQHATGISSHGASGHCAASSRLPSSSSPHAPEDRLIGIEEPMSELLELVLLPGEFEKATEQLRMSSIKDKTVEQLSTSHAERQKGNLSSLEGPIVEERLCSPTEVQKPRRQLRFVEGNVVEEISLPSPVPAEEQRLRVISIVGYRGIGKTALARAVYDVSNTVHSTSDCSAFDRVAWVVASQCSHAGDLLNNICQQVREQGNDTVTDVYMFKEILRSKRFLFVIDDLQEAGLWYDIQSAFPEAHTGSRVIVTTSIGSVAGACSLDRYIYRMRGLGYSDAEKLFWTKVDCRTNRTPSLEYALEDTLRKSGGLPLALISVANYLCRKRQDLPPGTPGAFEEMNRVLTQCYNSLPDDGHRTCFLSLSTFPQGHLIKRKMLIRRWIAEGLAVGDGVLGAEQVASNRFDELIDRNMVEPVLTGNINSKVKGFLVLGVVKDFIVNKSVSKEFVTLIHNDELLFQNKKVAHPVRRLSVHGGTTRSERVAKGIELDRVRSLTVCNTVPFDFKDCWLLRVLDLDACQGVDKMVVHNICKLIFLKYLSLRGSDVYKLSKKIKKLECLETLDIRETRVETLPIEVLMLPRLAHLFGQFELPQQLKDPATRSKLQAFFSDKSRLQTLSGFVMVENNGFEHIVLDIRLLRKITIWCKHSISSSYKRHLLTSSLQKRLAGRNALDSVSINFGNESINFLNNIGAPCALIGSMKLWGRLKSLPSFITSHDTTLSELQLSSTGLTIEALSLLQNLRRLLYLKLIEDGDGFCGDRFIVQSGGFPSLLRLCFEALKLPQIHIHEGGMSSVTSLLLLCPEFPTCNNTVSKESCTEGGRKISFKKIDSDISSEEIEENDSKRRSKEMNRIDLEMSFNEIDLAKKIETNYSEKLGNIIDLKKHFKGIEHLQRLNELVLHPSVSHEILDAWKEEVRSHVNTPKVTR
ncbi:disease resistance protein RGA4-like [Setaria viridis]|uniref:disease resistance protein RGA4-like n=1 Tax=Setaria viridis TaxID=4556 RepID=UPI003B3BD316